MNQQLQQKLQAFALEFAKRQSVKYQESACDPQLIEQALTQWTLTLFPQCAAELDQGSLTPLLLQKLSAIEHVFFDFDGVLTDNKVYTDQLGNESVMCDRADGLGIKQLKQQGKRVYILSTEANPVVQMRAKKLDVPCVQACKDKAEYMREWMQEQGVQAANVAFVGNDINDLGVMQEVGLALCPSDSDDSVLGIADVVLTQQGGNKVVRAIAALFEQALLNTSETESNRNTL